MKNFIVGSIDLQRGWQQFISGINLHWKSHNQSGTHFIFMLGDPN